MSARFQAPPVSAITNVTALVGRDLEPRICDIHIGDGLIAAITPVRQAGPPTGAPNPSEPARTIDGTGLIAMPGMVDVHDHLRVLAPGLSIAEGLPLDEFLKVQWATQARMGAHEYEVAAVLGTLQRLKCGITTVVDHAYTFHAPGLDDACLAGYEASGVRWAYARGVMTRPYEPVCETIDQAVDAIRSALDRHPSLTPANLFVAPVSIRQATIADFERCAALAHELGAGTYTHASETEAERRTWQQEAGADPIEALDRVGFLTDRTVLAHCVLLTDPEVDLLAARGVSVAHCPTNNMKLAKGVTRVPHLLAAGVNVCLGIDMMGDMHSEMRAELQMQSLHCRNPAVLGPRDVLQMATWRGAAAAGLDATTTAAAGLDATAAAGLDATATAAAGLDATATAAAGLDATAAAAAGLDATAAAAAGLDATTAAAAGLDATAAAADAGLAPGRPADIAVMPGRDVLQAPMVDPRHSVVHHTYGSMVRHVLVDGRLVVADGVSTLVDEPALVAEAEAAATAWLARLDLPRP